VKAINEDGDAPPSPPANATPSTVPNAPTSLIGTAGNKEIILNWTAPSDDGGAAITSYQYKKDTDAWVTIPGVLATNYTVTGLSNATSYNFIVRAVNASGPGSDSNSTGAVITNTVPNAPTSLIGTAGNKEIILNWTAPSDDGGAAISSYQYKQDADAWVTIPGVLATNYTVTGLSNATSYNFIVRAVNINGFGTSSSTTTVTTNTVPNEPTSLNGTAGDKEVSLTWTAPSDNGGAAISSYQYNQDGGIWNTISGALTTSHTVTGLSDATSYIFAIRAVNINGSGTSSDTTTVMTYSVPNEPTSLSGTAGNKEVALTWTAPSDDGGAAISSYQYKQDADAWVTIPGVLATNYTVTGLSNATSYNFMIRAVNSIGSGTQSSSTTVTTNAAQTLTWSSPLSVGNWLTCCSSADGTIMAAGNSTTNIYTSIDSGLNWSEETSSFLGCSSIACSADGLKLVAYCNTPDYRIWTALDSGSGYVWTEHTTGWPSGVGNMINVHLASSADGIKLAATSQWPGATGPSSSARYIYTSADSGANWTTALNTEKQWYDITSNSSGTELAAVTWFDNIWVSHDSGATWTETIPRPATSWLGISYSADASVLAAVVFSITVGGVDGTIWLSNDQGATWFKPTTHPVLSGPPKWYSISVSSDGSKLTCVLDAATTTDYAIWHSFDGGITWSADTGNPPGTGILGRDIASSSTQNTEVVVGGSEIWVGTTNTYVPDINFYNAVINISPQADAGTNYLKNNIIETITALDVGNANITDLTGIEGFTALDTLTCSGNVLTTLDMTSNTLLKELYCDGNQITSLVVTNNTLLETLECFGNLLTSLDVSTNTALSSMKCNNNTLTGLDVSTNTALLTLYCKNNPLNTLDVTANTALTNLACNDNLLSTLDVTANVALTHLYCYNNPIDTLDVTNNTALEWLTCYTNQLEVLDVTNNTALATLYCQLNEFTTLDVTQNLALTDLYCAGNKLTTIDVAVNSLLTGLFCSNNLLTSLDVSSNPALQYLVCSNNNIQGATGSQIITDFDSTFSGTFTATPQLITATGQFCKVKDSAAKTNFTTHHSASIPSNTSYFF
jgi:accessory colonization factor AcfC